MYVPEEMKLNKFKQVAIPRPIEYFSRFGLGNVPDGANYTGDEFAPRNGNKIDNIEDLLQYDAMKAKEELEKV